MNEHKHAPEAWTWPRSSGCRERTEGNIVCPIHLILFPKSLYWTDQARFSRLLVGCLLLPRCIRRKTRVGDVSIRGFDLETSKDEESAGTHRSYLFTISGTLDSETPHVHPLGYLYDLDHLSQGQCWWFNNNKETGQKRHPWESHCSPKKKNKGSPQISQKTSWFSPRLPKVYVLLHLV